MISARLLGAIALWPLLALAQPANDAAASAAKLEFGHRPLRPSAAPLMREPTEPEVFMGYAGVPPFQVAPRRDKLPLFPCSQCHKLMPVNATPRKLVAAPHNNHLEHGKGRLWCLDCHLAPDRDWLRTLSGGKVDFNDAYLVCGQCHFNRQRDWFFGGHGKRAVNWQGPRTVFNCTHCHDPHNPVIQPHRPSPPPPLRAGLSPMKVAREATPRPWEREGDKR